MKIEQWDIVRFRINPNDRDLHPGVVMSAPEWCDSFPPMFTIPGSTPSNPLPDHCRQIAREEEVIREGTGGPATEFPTADTRSL